MTSPAKENFNNNLRSRNYTGINRSPFRNIEPAFKETWEPSARDLRTKDQTTKFKEEFESFPLGAPIAQFNENYIISQNDDGIVIIDQHAAHERLVYEKLKKQIKDNNDKVTRVDVFCIVGTNGFFR
mgnify:CR=1 FL=1